MSDSLPTSPLLGQRNSYCNNIQPEEEGSLVALDNDALHGQLPREDEEARKEGYVEVEVGILEEVPSADVIAVQRKYREGPNLL